MIKFQLFDSVKLKEAVVLTGSGIAPEGTVSVIVEVFNDGEAYMVELFGCWVKYDQAENFVPAKREDVNSFLETIGRRLSIRNSYDWSNQPNRR